jgi:hypothetical protein
MDTIQHDRAMLGNCRQRAQMDGENPSFWLEEAAIRERLIVCEEQLRTLGVPFIEKFLKKKPPEGLTGLSPTQRSRCVWL